MQKDDERCFVREVISCSAVVQRHPAHQPPAAGVFPWQCIRKMRAAYYQLAAETVFLHSDMDGVKGTRGPGDCRKVALLSAGLHQHSGDNLVQSCFVRGL